MWPNQVWEVVVAVARATVLAAVAVREGGGILTHPVTRPAAGAAVSAALSATAAARPAHGPSPTHVPDAEASAAATAAKNAARAAAGFIADQVFEAIAMDAHGIDDVLPSHEIMSRPVWPTGAPDWVDRSWAQMKSALLALDEDWQVWTDWYEDRLRGLDDPRSRPLIQALEFDRIQIPNEDWEQGAKHVNAIIADLEAKHRAKVPQQRLATIEVEYHEDGKLHRRPIAGPEARDAAQEERLRSAWTAHSTRIASLDALDPGRNDPAFGRMIKDYRAALGSRYEELDVISLGVHGDTLTAYASRADDLFLEGAASEFVGVAASHGMFIRQFPVWQEYVKDSSGDLPLDALAAGVGLAREIRDATDIIDEDVADPLNALADAGELPLDPASSDQPPLMVKRELLRSIGNVLSGLFAPLLEFARDAGKGLLKGSVDGFEDYGKRITLAVLIGGSAYVAALATGLPAEFGWVTSVIACLKMALGK